MFSRSIWKHIWKGGLMIQSALFAWLPVETDGRPSLQLLSQQLPSISTQCLIIILPIKPSKLNWNWIRLTWKTLRGTSIWLRVTWKPFRSKWIWLRATWKPFRATQIWHRVMWKPFRGMWIWLRDTWSRFYSKCNLLSGTFNLFSCYDFKTTPGWIILSS